MSLPKIAVLGCGHWGKNHVRNMADFGVLTAVSDTDIDVAKKYATEYAVAALTPEELVHADVDGVVIASPAPTHKEWASKLMAAGKDVLVEKPICLEVAEAESLISEAQQQGRVLMVGHLLHYHPVFDAVKKMVHAGDIGDILTITSNRMSHGQIRTAEDVWWSFAPHDVSMVLGLMQEEPNKVVAEHHAALQDTISDVVTARLAFASGRVAEIRSNWLSPFKEQKLTVVGTKGMLVFDDTQAWEQKLTHYPAAPVVWEGDVPKVNKAEPVFVGVPQGEPLRNECQHFVDCIVNRGTPITDGVEAAAVLRVLQQGSRK